MEFVRSTIGSDHDSWLHIARHIASLILHECLPGSMSRMAAFIMSVEIWIKDISIECKNALQNETGDTVLPPLVCIHSPFHCIVTISLHDRHTA